MNFLIFQPIEGHVFAGLEDVGAVVLKDEFEVVDSFERDELFAVF